MSHRVTSPSYGKTVTSYGPDIAARARPVFVLSQDLLGLRNHILAIPLLGPGVEILGTAKWKLARTQKPRTRETAGSCDRDASGAAPGLRSGGRAGTRAAALGRDCARAAPLSPAPRSLGLRPPSPAAPVRPATPDSAQLGHRPLPVSLIRGLRAAATEKRRHRAANKRPPLGEMAVPGAWEGMQPATLSRTTFVLAQPTVLSPRNRPL